MKYMRPESNFVGIFLGSDNKYYSSYKMNIGKVPDEDNAVLTDLVFDFRTKVIYYEIYNGDNCVYRHPYLSENGKYCRFIDGDFEEIP